MSTDVDPAEREQGEVEFTIRPRFTLQRGVHFTPGRAEAFLQAIETGSEDKEACEYAGITLSGMRGRRRSDPEFDEAYRIARENRKEAYRMAAKRRAIDGWKEPVFYRGDVVGYRMQYSDRMLELLLKAEDPDNFSERHTVEVLVTPMTVDDVKSAVEMGKLEGAAEVFEQMAALVARAAEQKALEAGETVEGTARER